ncbi:MAG: DUF4349 domain-containing protein, partial [Acidobacteria bacterium]|nr:DUF4349 domain-containing protein [Acidobacteriota bacterium]MCA1640324.1 DUF4349 domain-containing protein [Acidobacteriota bacterium]
MKKIKFTAVLFFAILTACASAEKSSVAQNDNLTGEMSASAPLAQVSLDQADKSQTQTTVAERKIIRNADLTLESDAPEKAQQKITEIAESKNGFVIESNQSS